MGLLIFSLRHHIIYKSCVATLGNGHHALILLSLSCPTWINVPLKLARQAVAMQDVSMSSKNLNNQLPHKATNIMRV